MWKELGEISSIGEGVGWLPVEIKRQLIFPRDRINLLYLDLWHDENQAIFDQIWPDYLSIVKAYQRNIRGPERGLGIHEEVRRRYILAVDGQETEFIEATPHVRNIWVGEYVKLLTPHQASVRPHSDRSAWYYATVQTGKTPDMIVLARNGLYYAATKNDEVINASV